MKAALLAFAWTRGLLSNGQLRTVDGRSVAIESLGTPEADGGVAVGAKVIIGGAVNHGNVVLSCGESHTMCGSDTILVVTTDPEAYFCYENGDRTPTVVVNLPEGMEQRLAELCQGASKAVCGETIAAMDPFERVSLFTSLLTRRLDRKQNELIQLHRAGEDDWNSTLYTMVFRAMAGNRNKDVFTALARAIPYTALLRERTTPQHVEALLLGGAGLLHGHDDEPYIRQLNAAFVHLQRKYSITPLRASAWQAGGYPTGTPVLRLAELASFFTNREFIFNKVIACKTCADLYPIFQVDASPFWTTHYLPGSSPTESRRKSIGRDKTESMGINMVVPMMFAYGKERRDEACQERALQLLEDIPCESNSIVNRWKSRGTILENAFDSQAIIELNNEYCLKSRCIDCRIGKQQLGRVKK